MAADAPARERVFDFVVVGAGPCGLSMALRLAEAGRSVCVVDKASAAGGCHRSLTAAPEAVYKGSAGEFTMPHLPTEHGPRVYPGGYVAFWEFAAEVMSPEALRGAFTKYRHGVYGAQVRKAFLEAMTAREAAALAWAFCRSRVAGAGYGSLTVDSFCRSRGFSEGARAVLSDMCSIIDGADGSRTSLDHLLGVVDTLATYPVWTHSAPLDAPLWRPLVRRIREAGGLVTLGARVTRVEPPGGRGGVATVLYESGGVSVGRALCRHVALCVPPSAMLSVGGVPEEIGLSRAWALESRYGAYLCATLAFDAPVPEGVWGNPDGHPWRLVFVDFTGHLPPGSGGRWKGLVMVSVTRPGGLHPKTGVPAHAMRRGEVLAAVADDVQERLAAAAEGGTGGARPRVVAAAWNPTLTRDDDGWTDGDRVFQAGPWGFSGELESGGGWMSSWGHHAGGSAQPGNSIDSAVHHGQTGAARLLGGDWVPPRPRTASGMLRMAAALVLAAAAVYAARR